MKEQEWSLLIPWAANALIAGQRLTFTVPHRLVVRACTAGEARAAFKQLLGSPLPSGLTRRGDLIRGRGQEPSIKVQ